MTWNTSSVVRSKIGSQSEDLAPGEAQALVTPPGVAFGARGALVVADAEAIHKPSAEAGIGFQVTAELSLDGAALVRRSAPALMNPRKPPALLDLVERRLAGRNRRHNERYAAEKRCLDMRDRALPFYFAERGVDRHELAVGHDARQRDGHGLAVLAAAGIDGDESAGANRVVALGRHGNVGDAAGHESVSPAVARKAAPRPRKAPGGGRPLSPAAAARPADSRGGPTAAGGTNAVEGLPGPRRGVRHCEDAADLQQGLADNGRVAMVGEGSGPGLSGRTARQH